MGNHRKKPFAFAATSVIVGLVAAVVVAEAALRVFKVGYGTAPMNSDPVLHHVHPADYTFRVHHVSGEYGGHLVRYDDEGRTCDPYRQPVDASRARYRVAFLGDSYVEATQFPHADTFVGILQRGVGEWAALRNYGTSSYSPLYYLVQWRTRVAAFRPSHVFVVLFSNDVAGDADAIDGVTRDDRGEIVAIPGPGGGRAAEVLRKSYVVRLARRAQLQFRWWLHHDPEDAAYVVGGYVEENPDISELTSQLMEKLAEEIARSGALLTLMTVPSRYRLAHPEERYTEPEHSDKWKAWAAQRGIDFIDLTVPFRRAEHSGRDPFLPVDGHFNRVGHALVAEAIRAAYPSVFGPNAIHVPEEP